MENLLVLILAVAVVVPVVRRNLFLRMTDEEKLRMQARMRAKCKWLAVIFLAIGVLETWSSLRGNKPYMGIHYWVFMAVMMAIAAFAPPRKK